MVDAGPRQGGAGCWGRWESLGGGPVLGVGAGRDGRGQKHGQENSLKRETRDTQMSNAQVGVILKE